MSLLDNLLQLSFLEFICSYFYIDVQVGLPHNPHLYWNGTSGISWIFGSICDRFISCLAKKGKSGWGYLTQVIKNIFSTLIFGCLMMKGCAASFLILFWNYHLKRVKKLFRFRYRWKQIGYILYLKELKIYFEYHLF